MTKIDALANGVDRKVAVLEQMTERRVQQVAAAQARRTSTILSFLTALTIVTVAVALITNFLGSRSDTVGHVWIRAGIVVFALVVSVLLYREAFRRRPRRDLGIRLRYSTSHQARKRSTPRSDNHREVL